ncbi:hypothetical protein QE152_g9789 [Popillia japonica]|uniref:Uncharacterized protein n=1 Tax=Popillia japonica TaxID=7064 RepID=A0AAW1LTQ2_POPJA
MQRKKEQTIGRRNEQRTDKKLAIGQEEKMQRKKEQTIGRRNEQRTDKKLAIGQEVYVKPAKYYTQKTKERYRGPFTISKINDDNTVEVEDIRKRKFKYHINSLKLGFVAESLSEED